PAPSCGTSSPSASSPRPTLCRVYHNLTASQRPSGYYSDGLLGGLDLLSRATACALGSACRHESARDASPDLARDGSLEPSLRACGDKTCTRPDDAPGAQQKLSDVEGQHDGGGDRPDAPRGEALRPGARVLDVAVVGAQEEAVVVGRERVDPARSDQLSIELRPRIGVERISEEVVHPAQREAEGERKRLPELAGGLPWQADDQVRLDVEIGSNRCANRLEHAVRIDLLLDSLQRGPRAALGRVRDPAAPAAAKLLQDLGVEGLRARPRGHRPRDPELCFDQALGEGEYPPPIHDGREIEELHVVDAVRPLVMRDLVDHVG